MDASELYKGEYEHCIFRQANFEYADLSGFRFNKCRSILCNLSLANLFGAIFSEVVFDECKLLGLRFDQCNQLALSVTFNSCLLHNAVFYKASLKKTQFTNSNLMEADFSECDLSGAVFADCDLSGAVFDGTNLEKADLRTSVNYSINPAVNRLKKAKFSLSGIPGLLDALDIEIDRNH